MIAILLNDASFEQDIRELLMAFYPGETFTHKEEEAGEAELIVRGTREGDSFSLDVTPVKKDGSEKVISMREIRASFGAQPSEGECPECSNDLNVPDASNASYQEQMKDALHFASIHPDFSNRFETKNEIKQTLYRLLSAQTGKELPWGTLTGIRPTKIALTKLYDGWTDEQIETYMRETYFTSKEKIDLSIDVAERERRLLSTIDYENGYSLYVGIPFCPTTCLYCSFTSFPIVKWEKRMDLYKEALFKEMEYVAEQMKDRPLSTIYFGGGTPTSLNPQDLDEILTKVEELFPVEQAVEFTVESGRPDSITREKLQVLRNHGISRISINPQTMKQATLDLIGRRHTVEDVKEKFRLARELGFDNINMDLIVGLPGETIDDVRQTMEEIKALGPDSVTVHSLAIKRAARLNIYKERYGNLKIVNTQEMIDLTAQYAEEMGLKPYYLYRQKNMAGNFENVGYAVPGKECLYNILIMEEKQTIAACGAGTTTKVYFPAENRIERAENVKEVEQYIDRIDEMIGRKEKLLGRRE